MKSMLVQQSPGLHVSKVAGLLMIKYITQVAKVVPQSALLQLEFAAFTSTSQGSDSQAAL